MKKIILLLPLLLALTPIKKPEVSNIQTISNRNFNEIETWKREIDTRDFAQLKGYTTAELQAFAPEKEYRVYWNKTTNEFWVSTGTLTNQFVHK